MTVSGKCLCGEVKITAQGEPNDVAICYCEDCRKQSGNLGHLVAVYNTDQVKVDDPNNFAKTWVNTNTDSGKSVNNHFCGQCSLLYSTVPMVYDGAVTMLRYTALDDTGQWKNMPPKSVVHKKDRCPFYKTLAEL